MNKNFFKKIAKGFADTKKKIQKIKTTELVTISRDRFKIMVTNNITA